jgi:hypothetical protein
MRSSCIQPSTTSPCFSFPINLEGGWGGGYVVDYLVSFVVCRLNLSPSSSSSGTSAGINGEGGSASALGDSMSKSWCWGGRDAGTTGISTLALPDMACDGLSHVTRHTLHVTHHTSHVTCRLVLQVSPCVLSRGGGCVASDTATTTKMMKAPWQAAKYHTKAVWNENIN